MDLLLTFVLPMALFVVLEFLWCRPTWLRSPADVRPEGERQPGVVPHQPDADPFALSFIRQRLDALADELDRLEDDESIFAKAFRTQVARSAYTALLADASRMAETSRFAGISPLTDTTLIEVEMARSFGPLAEELEV